jgi:hypothetical protein
VVLRLPIMWANAARIENPVRLSVAGKTDELAAGTLLQAVDVIAPDQPGEIKAGYCTPPRHGERALEHGMGAVLFGGGMLTRQIAHKAQSGQFCLFDLNGGGRFDEIRYFSSGLPDGTAPEKLNPLPFTKLTIVPVSPSSQDEIRISVSHISRHSLELKLDIIQVGQARVFSSITTTVGISYRYLNINLDKSLPQHFQLMGIDFDIVQTDIVDKSVTIRFSGNVDNTRFQVISEDTKMQYCFGYVCRPNNGR